MQTFRRLWVTSMIAAIGLMVLPVALANMGSDDSDMIDDPNFLDGKKAVESEDWAKAIDLLSKAVQAVPNNSDAHNLLGYAYRKSGRMDASFAQYNEALKLDPQNKHAHEYIGEAYLMTDNLPKAEQHLAELRRLCTPIPCEEYKELRRAVEAYKKAKK
jgi:Flp pilus assembly protein TadD